MATGAAQMMVQCIFDGCVSISDMDLERRPYHRNCSCALHDARPSACFQHQKVSYSNKKSWNNCSLSMASPLMSVQSSHHSDSSNRIAEEAFKVLSKR